MAKTINLNNSDGTPTLMREYLRRKMLGNVAQFTADLKADDKFLEMTLEQLARDMAQHASRAGLKFIDGEGDVFITAPRGESVSDPLTMSGTIGAKLYAEWSERPVDLLIFTVHAMLDAQDREKRAGKDVERERRRYTALLKRLAAAKDMDGVRAAIDHDDDYDY